MAATPRILPAKPAATLEEANARLAQLETMLAQKSRVYFKVSPKGAVSIYGLGRFPFTWYKSQIATMKAQGMIWPALDKFVTTNAASLSEKPEHTTAA